MNSLFEELNNELEKNNINNKFNSINIQEIKKFISVLQVKCLNANRN